MNTRSPRFLGHFNRTAVGATIFTGLYFLNPPWEWKVADPGQQSSASTAPAMPRQSTIAASPSGASGTAIAQQAPMAVQTVEPIAPPEQYLAMSPQPVTPAKVPEQQPSPTGTMPVMPQAQARDIQQPTHEGITSQVAAADQNCGTDGPMEVALTPPSAVAGRVEGFLPEAEAMALIPRSEEAANGKIDPAYVHNLRALFHPDGAPPNVRVPVLVPVGMNVYVGEHVNMVGGHASPSLACHYIPNLIVGSTTGP